MVGNVLSREQVQAYEKAGYLVIRSVFSGGEVARVVEAIMRVVYRNDMQLQDRVPQASVIKFDPGSNYLEDSDLASVASCPFIVESAEALLSAPVALSKWNAYLKKPGVGGTAVNPGEWGGDYESLHPRAHMDYKTYHPPGSSVDWLFSIVPLVDLNEQTGPLYVSPGSHKLSRVFSDGRVKRVQRSNGTGIVPLIDLKLRRGDLLLMNMFTWHEGGANRSNHNRLGLYNKYRAINAPPACGPELYSDEAHAAVIYRGQSLLPHHGNHGIRTTALLLELDDKFLLTCSETSENGWSFPGGSVRDSQVKSAFGNLIGSLETDVREKLGLDIPWMTYIGDFKESSQFCRVYAHLLTASSRFRIRSGMRVGWFTRDEICHLSLEGELAEGYEVDAINLWLNDEFQRGMGIAKRPPSGPTKS